MEKASRFTEFPYLYGHALKIGWACHQSAVVVAQSRLGVTPAYVLPKPFFGRSPAFRGTTLLQEGCAPVFRSFSLRFSIAEIPKSQLAARKGGRPLIFMIVQLSWPAFLGLTDCLSGDTLVMCRSGGIW